MILGGWIIEYGILVCSALLIFSLIMIKRSKNKRIASERIICILVTIMYITILLNTTLFPIPVDPLLINDRLKEGLIERNNFVPLKTIYEISKESSLSTVLTQLGGNLLLLSPLGCLLPVIFKVMRSLKLIFVLGLSTSLIIEIIQFLISYRIGISYRSFDIDDIILNSIGTTIGYGFYKYLYPIFRAELFGINTKRLSR
ncbi:VanZ family protein [Bacillus subtilis]|nr:VanZ family protein [Bacillus velezensis]AYK76518.1 VanZ family protein [Bacillus subtilis subsp. subtilis]AYL03147.1 VanZ family protein [Bacillus subtilis subsp. subtilis]UNL91991.1 VanZ family protein [Bacillus subtilis]